MEKMSDRIVRLRKERGLTQEQLAEYTGLTRSAIAKYERGLVENMTATNIQALASFFGVRPSYLMCLDEESSINPQLLQIGLDMKNYTPHTPEQKKQIEEFARYVLKDNKKEN